MTLPQWRARLARWFAAKLEAKPDYAQITIGLGDIGLGDDGREPIRVQRSSSGTADIAPDMMRLPPDQRDAFRSAVKASPGAILVAPIELQLQDQSAPAPQAVPRHPIDRTDFGRRWPAAGSGGVSCRSAHHLQARR
ncbi:MAG: hypothetical protein MZV49_17945 [Rhodopseudomonas palustris]|nr:hypothetical protein [Rhodopseudomonas palustris]